MPLPPAHSAVASPSVSDAAAGTASLEKALDVLDALGAAPQGLTQVELAQRLGLPRTTLYRLLATLVTRGLVRRDARRRVYALGFRCIEWGRAAGAAPDLSAAAALEMRALRDLTGETTYLACLDGHEVLSVERVDGAHSQRSAAALGQRKPLHCTSQGKAILSALPVPARDALLRHLPLTALTPQTITSRRRLVAEIERSAQRGYAIDDEEIVQGVRCVGAPVRDTAGQVRGALSVAGPAYRLSRARLDLLGPEVAEAARRVGAQLVPLQDVGASAEQRARVLSAEWAFAGVHPCWEPQAQRLYWADALAPSLRVWEHGPGRPDRLLTRLEAPVLGLLVLPRGLLVSFEAGYRWVDADGAASPLQPWSGEPGWSPAVMPRAPDQLCAATGGGSDTDASAGSVWVSLAAPGRTHLGRWTPGQGLALHWHVQDRVTALAASPDGRLFAACADSGQVLVLRPGHSAAQRLATLPPGSGQLAGLACDALGGVWASLRGGWSVLHIAPDGQTDRVLGLAVPSPSDLCLGGVNGNTLFVTTARQDLSLEALQAAPLSGHLLALPVSA